MRRRVVSGLALLTELGLAFGGLGLAVWRGAVLVQWFRAWLRWRVADPSAAELYEVNCWFEAVHVTLALGLTAFGVLLLRRRREGAD